MIEIRNIFIWKCNKWIYRPVYILNEKWIELSYNSFFIYYVIDYN